MVNLDINAIDVAVIILTLNQRDRTLQCLASLLTQDGSSFQVLVRDNGSQDGTAAAIQDKFPKVMVDYHPVPVRKKGKR